jgi:hypothetical protein
MMEELVDLRSAMCLDVMLGLLDGDTIKNVGGTKLFKGVRFFGM